MSDFLKTIREHPDVDQRAAKRLEYMVEKLTIRIHSHFTLGENLSDYQMVRCGTLLVMRILNLQFVTSILLEGLLIILRA